MNPKKQAFIHKFGLPIGLLAIILIIQAVQPSVPLLSLLNIKIYLQTVSVFLAALGLSYIMISGEGDMSFAGMFSMLSVVFAIMANRTNSFFISILIALACALLVNMIIVFLVAQYRFSSFIVSIAFMFMVTGIEKHCISRQH